MKKIFVNIITLIVLFLFLNGIGQAVDSPFFLIVSTTQGSNVLSHSFQVKNSGTSTLSYAIPDNTDWLSFTPASGTPKSEQDTFIVNYSISGLSAGTYLATIIVTVSDTTNSPMTIPVILNVVNICGSARMKPLGNGNLAIAISQYGSDSDIWSYNGKILTKPTDWIPSSSTRPTVWGGTNLAISFSDYGIGNGMWLYDGSSWSKISDWSAADLIL